MLGDFIIDISKTRECIKELETVEKILKKRKNNLEDIRSNLTVSGKGVSMIKQQIKQIADELEISETVTHQMKESMEEIIRIYELAEAKLSGNHSSVEYVKSHVKDYLEDVLDGFIDKYEDWIDKIKEEQESIVLRIDDKDTREGFSDKYREILQSIYDDVPDEYKDAKELYDKYSESLIVENFDTKDEDGDAKAYHSNGKLYINETSDLNNPRGDGTTFYHEYGHYIVHEEGWIKNKECTGEFKKFEESLRKEVEQYYKNYEEQFRNEAISKGYTGEQIDDYVLYETKRAINEDINGSSDEYFDVNNGMSDIIDGVSNGKYQPSYGHDKDYWDKDSSRVANEAFAQIFSAQMTGDTTELEKMKEIMPETYEIYMEMIADAA